MIDADLAELIAHTADPAWLKAQGLFVAEGRLVATRLLESPSLRLRALLLTPTAEVALTPIIEHLPADRRARVVVVPQEELDGLTGFRLHQGCVAFAERPEPAPWIPGPADTGVSVLLERVRDPDNVGSIARSAAAFGANALILGPECADPFYRKAVRTSMGAVLSCPPRQAVPWPDVLTQARASGLTMLATVLDPSAPPLDEVIRQLEDRPVVLLIGSEGEGLSETARRHSDFTARIPMTDAVDSLNVGVATAIAVYALTRRTRQ